ncbi:MAG TPA: outer membrane protein assembly factor BamA [Alphaproteobacteria bacterium]|jgi:outer membrane protein insertion porin family
MRSGRAVGGKVRGLWMAAVAALWLGLTGLVPAPTGAQIGGEPGGIIREIRVEGIERIEPETVRSYIQLRAGEPFDPARIDDSLKALFATGLFADVSIRREGDVVVVRVVENPIINRIAFEGNDVVENQTLEQEVQLRPRVVYTRTRVQNDVKRIQELYRRQGRFAVTVEPKVIQRSQNRVDLVFEINEGPSTVIRTISFIGNEAFSDSRLRSVIQSAETRWYSFLTGDDVYDPDRLNYDEELLRRYYLENGYADFRVLSTAAELSDDRENFFITFTVEEGRRYRVGRIELTSEFPRLDTSKIREAVTFKEGDWYNAEEIDNTLSKLTDAAAALGFVFVDPRAVPRRDREKGEISVEFNIREGPRQFVERIEIRGNVRTQDRVIRREFRLIEGDAFSAAKLRRSEQRVRDLNYFKKVTVNRVPGTAPDKTVIQVDVEEKSTGSLSLGAGVSSTQGLLSQLQLIERNLLGKGQILNFTLSLGTKAQEYEIGFTEPHFLERNLSAGFDLFKTTREKTDSITFEQSRIGFGLRSGFNYNERLRQTVGYKLESKEVTDIDDDASLFVKEQEGESTTSAISQSLTYDVRDSRVDPTEGYVLRLANDLSGFGGDTRYLRTKLTGVTYHQLISDWIGRFSLEAGYVQGIGKDVRIDDRFFIGGDSFRGFATGGLGPRDEATGDALGGNQYVTASAEVGMPLGTSTTYRTRWFVFSDAGSVWGIDNDAPGVLDSTAIRLSVGLGVGVTTPFGTVRLNYAFPVLKEDFDETEAFSFRIGTSF